MSAPPTIGRASRFWRFSLLVMYRGLRLIDPLIRSWQANGLGGLDGVVEVSIIGRTTGRSRATLLTLLSVGGEWYIGHPNGESAWTRNAEAAGVVRIDPPSAHGSAFSVVRLPRGPERDSVIAATRVQQPFPGNLVYRAATRHIYAVGVYFRLVPAAEDAV
jgi:hypothetical protein